MGLISMRHPVLLLGGGLNLKECQLVDWIFCNILVQVIQHNRDNIIQG